MSGTDFYRPMYLLSLDNEAAIAYLYLDDGSISHETKEIAPGIFADYDNEGNIIGIEIFGVKEQKTEE